MAQRQQQQGRTPAELIDQQVGHDKQTMTIEVEVHVNPDIDSMVERVARFNREIIGYPQPERVSTLSPARKDFRAGHLREEIQEFEMATEAGDTPAAADAMIDLIYVALGTLYEMGVSSGPVFDAVHHANMQKVRGEKSTRPGSQGHDAIKPEGWEAPNHDWILEATPERVAAGMVAERRNISPDLLADISDVFIHVAKVRAGKGRDYNTSVQLHDYFPMGHQSYFQMQWLKTLRSKSIVELMDRGMVPNYEGLLDTLYDQLNYVCFWAEAINEGRLPITGNRGADANGAVRTKC